LPTWAAIGHLQCLHPNDALDPEGFMTRQSADRVFFCVRAAPFTAAAILRRGFRL